MEQPISTFCIACGKSFEMPRKNSKRCPDCVANDVRATKKSGVHDSEQPLSVGMARAMLEGEGFGIIEPQPFRKDVAINPKKSGTAGLVRVGVVSDTHFGSMYQQPTALHRTYAWFKEKKVSAIMHAGDLSDGSPRMHLGMGKEQFLHTSVATVNYIVDTYPVIKGVPTYLIGGNHDLSWEKNDGVDVPKEFADRRKDIVYLGRDRARVIVGDQRIELVHPDGGGTAHTALVKKFIEREPVEWNLPDVLLAGHLHRFSMVLHRGVLGIELPSYQAQSPWMARKALIPSIGGLILTIKQNGSTSLEWLLFSPKDGDY